jgi:predicted KAP-like P-loop ATPase
MLMQNYENFKHDKPIFGEQEDAFQRYGFTKRIADTIINRTSNESIVYGIYGKWGEGKTSVLNLINNEITNSNKDYINITFNPWMYNDESFLLTSFFNKLGNLILACNSNEQLKNPKEKKIKWPNWNQFKNKPLNTRKENIGELLQTYGKCLNVLPVNVGDFAESLGKAFSNVNLEDLKKRIENHLENFQKKIVIYIDDIDRLDKNEIYSILRLVKLTANFKNTIYILSFDNEMVAAAIGEKFGTGGKKSGENYLEKIIQIPLYLPQATFHDLQNYCFESISQILFNNLMDFNKNEFKEFIQQFSSNILPRLSNPREVLRYSNSLSFTIPMLKGEVNISDLMLIEAIKIFYPAFYDFIKYAPYFFIDPYISNLKIKNEEKTSEYNKHFNRLTDDILTETEKKCIIELIEYLFPFTNTNNSLHYFRTQPENQWYRNKRIASKDYFDRYFTYSVLKGDISDIEFNKFLDKVQNCNTTEEVKNNFNELIRNSNSTSFLIKIQGKENDLDWEKSEIFIKALCELSPLFKNDRSTNFFNNFTKLALLIVQLFYNNREKSNIFNFFIDLLSFPTPIDFALELYYWILNNSNRETNLFTDDEIKNCLRQYIDRIIQESKSNLVFENFPNILKRLAKSWADFDKDEYNYHAKLFLDKEIRNVITYIKLFVPLYSSSSNQDYIEGDLNEENYKIIVSLYDKEDLCRRILTIYTREEIEQSCDWRSEFDEINMLRQFYVWYKKEKRSS